MGCYLGRGLFFKIAFWEISFSGKVIREFFITVVRELCMIAFSFCNGCFNTPNSEEMIYLVTAPKALYASRDDFVSRALEFLDSDDELRCFWTEEFRDRVYTPVSDKDLEWLKSRLEKMNQKITIVYEPVLSAAHLKPPTWDDMTVALETAAEYLFVSWGTSA